MKEGLDGRELKPGRIRAEAQSEGTGQRDRGVAQVTHPAPGAAEGWAPWQEEQMELGSVCRDSLDLLPSSVQPWGLWLHGTKDMESAQRKRPFFLFN